LDLYATKGRKIILNNDKYTSMQLDFIKELANVGGGNAATSISQLIKKPVNMTLPIIDLIDYEELYETTMAEDTVVNAVIMKMFGDAEGTFLFVTSDGSLNDLINMMMPAGIVLTDELSQSGIKELVNILVTSFVNAISKLVNINIISSVPVLTMEMFGAILSGVYMESEQYDENIMIIKNEFLYNGDIIQGTLYFVPKPGVLTRLFEIIGI
jgi:chemotaxis protein CheC